MRCFTCGLPATATQTSANNTTYYCTKHFNERIAKDIELHLELAAAQHAMWKQDWERDCKK